jgi:uncharacterized membrane protein (TIGR02234 family)
VTTPGGGRRELTIAVTCCLVGALAVFIAAGRAWVHARATQGSLQLPLAVRGGSAVPAAPALAIVGLAGALALLATRGLARALTGAVVAGCGVGAALAAARGAHPDNVSLAARAGAALGTGSAHAEDVATNGWPLVAVAGGCVFAVGGALAMVRGRRWPGMSARYDAPQGAAAVPPGGVVGVAPEPDRARPEGALELWRALDRGEDPTL